MRPAGIFLQTIRNRLRCGSHPTAGRPKPTETRPTIRRWTARTRMRDIGSRPSHPGLTAIRRRARPNRPSTRPRRIDEDARFSSRTSSSLCFTAVPTPSPPSAPYPPSVPRRHRPCDPAITPAMHFRERLRKRIQPPRNRLSVGRVRSNSSQAVFHSFRPMCNRLPIGMRLHIRTNHPIRIACARSSQDRPAQHDCPGRLRHTRLALASATDRRCPPRLRPPRRGVVMAVTGAGRPRLRGR